MGSRNRVRVQLSYTVKKVNDFPVPSRDVTNQTLPGRECLNYSRPVRVWLVTPRLGPGKWQTFFYSVPSRQATLAGRVGSLESIPGLPKSVKIPEQEMEKLIRYVKNLKMKVFFCVESDRLCSVPATGCREKNE
jgi:hypothetical protein